MNVIFFEDGSITKDNFGKNQYRILQGIVMTSKKSCRAVIMRDKVFTMLTLFKRRINIEEMLQSV